MSDAETKLEHGKSDDVRVLRRIGNPSRCGDGFCRS
jgi:hypothetical protein